MVDRVNVREVDRVTFGESFLGVPFIAMSAVCLVLSITFLFVGPRGYAGSLRGVVARYAHSLCWVLLAIAALGMSRLTPMPYDWARPFGALGGVSYLAFLFAAFMK